MKRVTILTALISAISWSVSAQTADAYLTQGNEHLRAKRYTEAPDAYTSCINNAPRDTRCLFNRGLVRPLAIGFGLALEDQYQEKHGLALGDLTEAIKLLPLANYYAFRGISHKVLDNKDGHPYRYEELSCSLSPGNRLSGKQRPRKGDS